MHGTEDELATLQRRAYARGGDIATDPAALARLLELENGASGRRPEAEAPTSSPADQPAEEPRVTEPTSDPASETQTGRPLRIAQRIQVPRLRRSTTIMLLAGVLVLVCALTSLELVQRVQSDPLQTGATQIARLQPDSAYAAPLALSRGETENVTVYSLFEGFRAITFPASGSTEPGDLCMTVWQPDLLIELGSGGFSYEGSHSVMTCRAGVFPPSWTLLLGGNTPERAATGFPAGTALQFVYDAASNEVVVFKG